MTAPAERDLLDELEIALVEACEVVSAGRLLSLSLGGGLVLATVLWLAVHLT